MALLEVNNLSVFFGGIKAVQNVSFQAEKGEFIGLIGPNGAGKTTVSWRLFSAPIPAKAR